MKIENVNLEESDIELCNMDLFDLDKTIDNMVTPNLTVKKSVVKKRIEKKDHEVGHDFNWYDPSEFYCVMTRKDRDEMYKIFTPIFNNLLKENKLINLKVGMKITESQYNKLRELKDKASSLAEKEYSKKFDKSKSKPKPKKVDKTGNGNLEPQDIVKRGGKRGARGWAGTCNNYTQDDIDFYDKLFEKDKSIVYFVYGFEVGEKCKTPHLQMFIYFKNAKTFDVMCKKYCKVKPTEWSQMRTNEYDCAKYCKKDGDYKEFGTPPKQNQGRRVDLEDVYKKIKEGATFSDIAEYAPGLAQRYANGIDRLIREQYNKPRTESPNIYWIWGESGSGKTYSVTNGLKPDDYYMKANNRWWDGYQQQDNVIFDEYNAWMSIEDLNMLISPHRYLVEVKGGTIHFNSKNVYIISAAPPHELYKNKVTGKQFKQFWRRIMNNVYYFSSDHQVFKDGYDDTDDNLLAQTNFFQSKELISKLNEKSSKEFYEMMLEKKDRPIEIIENNIKSMGEARYSKLEWEEPENDMTDDED